MKTLTGLILILLPGVIVYGQQARTTTPPTPQSAPRVIAEISASTDKIVKGAPFSAEAVSESIQTLSDGNRIVRRWTDKLYRSSEGKFRREGSGIPGSAFGAIVTNGSGVTILDPVGGARYTINTDDKTVRSFTLRTPAPVIVSQQMNLELKRKIEAAQQDSSGAIILNGDTTISSTSPEAAKIKAELDAVKAAEVRAVTAAKLAATAVMAAPAALPRVDSRWETRTEELGTQNFEGVDAEGTRTITTIPADAIGNERPIEIVYERWYSKELQLIVYSRHVDPRFGEQTYRLTNINRSEPDPSLFQVPTSFRLLNPSRTSQSTRATVERVTTSKTAQASRP